PDVQINVALPGGCGFLSPSLTEEADLKFASKYKTKVVALLCNSLSNNWQKRHSSSQFPPQHKGVGKEENPSPEFCLGLDTNLALFYLLEEDKEPYFTI
ncbi:hypothetical protein NDI49_30725, partial [Trichocoleus sp. ST-U3]